MTKSRRPNTAKQPKFQVKPVYGYEVAAIILECLSRDYGDVCNYLDAVKYAREGNAYMAYLAVVERNRGVAETSPRHVWVKAQASAALKKLCDPELDQWLNTREAWWADEHRCRRLNQKFVALMNRRGRKEKAVPTALSRALYRVYEALHFVLGDEPDLKMVAEEAHYGPGSTVSVRGREVHYVRKTEAFECTPLAVDLAAEALSFDKAVWAHVGMDPIYADSPSAREGFLRVTRQLLQNHTSASDRLMFIHKNIEILRSIGAQPTCSGMLQLGVHNIGRRLLMKVGIDLGDQNWNQKLALEGSRDWDNADPLCTLDKTRASNMIAREILLFFPPAWAKLLRRIRSTHYDAPPEIGGGNHEYQLFAGMGNGTTFFVETLLFFAMAYATCEDKSVEEFVSKRQYAVYGDDVILRRRHAKRYMRLAHWFGFKFGANKTFLTGKFRESCGADYYEGVNVRPAYVKSEGGQPQMEQLDLIGVHNTLADNMDFPMHLACERIRALWEKRLYPVTPTDPSGNLGFRPVGDRAYYTIVRDRTGSPVISSWWQRPRTYVLDVRPKFADVGDIDHWTQVAISLLRARQSGSSVSRWGLPYRDLVNVKIVAETDMPRKSLVLMVANQLSRLAERKAQPWFANSRGL